MERRRLTKTAKLLCELIARPSVNAAFLPEASPYAGEQRVVEFVAATAARAHLDVELQHVARRRANVLIRLAPPGVPRQRILLAPHTDTVGGAELNGTLFVPRCHNGRLYGRGACDTKGCVAAMLGALMEVAHSGQRPAHTEIIFAGLVDEEYGQAGSRALARGRYPADLAIVGEPTRLRVVTAHKGLLWLRLETRGKAAHGARPELGCNAIHLMARVVDLLETEYAAHLRRRRHPLLGHATVNVGSIRGGQQPNIVPDRCAISVDRRLLPGEEGPRVRRELKNFLRSRRLAAIIRATETHPCFPLETSPRLPLVQQLLRSTGQTRPAGVDYFSDAGVLAAGGIPSVLFGPGDIAQAHTPDEWISLRQLERGRELLVRFLRSLP